MLRRSAAAGLRSTPDIFGGEIRRRLRLAARIRCERAKRPDDVMGAVTFDGALHAFAIEGDVAVGAVRRPRVDHHGDLICMMRMDGTRNAVTQMAIRKATTVTNTTGDSGKVGDFLRSQNFDVTDFSGNITKVPGGVRVIEPDSDGKILYGAIGVSGRHPGSKDEALALIGLKALQKAVWG